ncbi:hypothetical protein ANO11243_091210 [Dothideomycetidae sp. 11243]|nr:hypothetical protein ANO11243_091210 [fungal sp. No.11243]
MDPPFKEGDIPFTEGTISFEIAGVRKPCSTYYKVYGDLKSNKTPVVCAHGGPGGSCAFTSDFGVLWPRYGIPVIVYDQMGCGKSTNLDDEKAGDETFWVASLFVEELENLLRHFQFGENRPYNLLGLSWGSMLLADFATTQPKGLQRLVLGCPFASMDLVMEGMRLRVLELPIDVQKAINEGIEKGQWNTDAFRAAFTVYFQHALCRANPMPERLRRFSDYMTMRTTARDTSNPTMIGTCPIATSKTVGSLRNFNLIPRLHQINVKTLAFNGEFDQAHDVAVQPFLDLVPSIRWYTFAGASHILTYESEELREKCFKLVGDFLDHKDIAA